MVIWVIGLSGSGKTTIGRAMVEILQSSSNPWVMLDGDSFREAMGEDLGHDLESRRINAYRISRFCSLLESQGISVLACVLSLFPDNREYNRKILRNYKEVYLKVTMNVLRIRDNKGLYQDGDKGLKSGIAGVDIPFVEPENPDFVYDNSQGDVDVHRIGENILIALGFGDDLKYRYPRGNRNSERYQYTPLEGPNFLNRYREIRRVALNAWEQLLSNALPGQIHSFEALDNQWVQLGFSKLEANVISKDMAANNNVEISGCFSTRPFLLAGFKSLNWNWNELSRLIRSFEVGKSIYDRYENHEIRKMPNSKKDPFSECLFGLALGLACGKWGKSPSGLIAGNALLKLVDFWTKETNSTVSLAMTVLRKKTLELEMSWVNGIGNESQI